jgi:hypothetical protein
MLTREVLSRILLACGGVPVLSLRRPIRLVGRPAGQEDDHRKSREAGFDDHLVKPVEVR